MNIGKQMCMSTYVYVIMPGLELQILKGNHFKVILKGQLRAPRLLHVKE